MNCETVVKFGRSETAFPYLEKTAKMLLEQPEQKVIVLSPPGGHNGQVGVIDLLQKYFNGNYQQASRGQRNIAFSLLEDIVRSSSAALGVPDYQKDLTTAITLLDNPKTSNWGIEEAGCLVPSLVARKIGAQVLKPTEFLQFDQDQNVDPASYELAASRIDKLQGRVVIPGFFGRSFDGRIRIMNTSDTAAAVLARGLGAKSLDVWTWHEGIYAANPSLYSSGVNRDKPVVIPELTYAELAELGERGMGAIDPASLRHLDPKVTQVHIRNISDSLGKGTIITRFREATNKTDIVGLASDGPYTPFVINMAGMEDVVGVGASIAEAFGFLGIPYQRGTSGKGYGRYYVSDKFIKESTTGHGAIEDCILNAVPGFEKSVKVEPEVGLLSVVGQGMKDRSSYYIGRLMSWLDEAELRQVQVLDNTSLSFSFTVPFGELTRATRTLHDRFFRD